MMIVTVGQKKKFVVLVIGLLIYLANGTKSQRFRFTNRQIRQRQFLEKNFNRRHASSDTLMTNLNETTDKPVTISEGGTVTTLKTTPGRGIITKPPMPTTESKTVSTTSAFEKGITRGAETANASELSTTSVTTVSTEIDPNSEELSSTRAVDLVESCGIRTVRRTGRIVGGQNSYLGKWPWHALVKHLYRGRFINGCGGVLINSKYVISAAHCIPWYPSVQVVVVLGTNNFTKASDAQYLSEVTDNVKLVIRNAKRMFVHRDHNALRFMNDLALLEMESAVDFLPHVAPICLPNSDDDFTGKVASVIGWGSQRLGGIQSKMLQEAQVPIVSNAECERMYFQAGYTKTMRRDVVCAGFKHGGKDSCSGDSGGPLMAQRDDGRWVVVGIVSHGVGCALPNQPGIYTRISSYRNWIDFIVQMETVKTASAMTEEHLSSVTESANFTSDKQNVNGTFVMEEKYNNTLVIFI